ncbi:MAG: GDYXXLXY domain-containing protein [Bosea sp. (in: a-proteobacteria)]
MIMTADAAIARVPAYLRYLLGAIILCGLILVIVVQRATILKEGREVRLEVVPVDPRDLFRGDYVILSYLISTVDASVDQRKEFTRGQQVFVTLRPDATGLAKAVVISAKRPQASGQDVIIAGVVSSTSQCSVNAAGARDCAAGQRAVGVRYGLESYFVPQGEGRVIEIVDKKRLEIVAAVAPSGQAAIKRLMLDGKPLYTEPPY